MWCRGAAICLAKIRADNKGPSPSQRRRWRGGRVEGADEGGASEPPAQVKGLGGSAGYKDAWRRGETPPCVSYPLSNCKSPLKENGGDAFLIPLFFFHPLLRSRALLAKRGFSYNLAPSHRAAKHLHSCWSQGANEFI